MQRWQGSSGAPAARQYGRNNACRRTHYHTAGWLPSSPPITPLAPPCTLPAGLEPAGDAKGKTPAFGGMGGLGGMAGTGMAGAGMGGFSGAGAAAAFNDDRCWAGWTRADRQPKNPRGQICSNPRHSDQERPQSVSNAPGADFGGV